MLSTVLLNFYDLGNKIGGPTSIALSIVLTVLLIWVMIKYLDTSDLN